MLSAVEETFRDGTADGGDGGARSVRPVLDDVIGPSGPPLNRVIIGRSGTLASSGSSIETPKKSGRSA